MLHREIYVFLFYLCLSSFLLVIKEIRGMLLEKCFNFDDFLKAFKDSHYHKKKMHFAILGAIKL